MGRRRRSAAELALAVALVVTVAGCALPPSSGSGSTGGVESESSGTDGGVTGSPAPTRASPSARRSPTAHPTPTRSTPARQGTALAALAHLVVKGRAPMTGYRRARFGPSWPDVDGNGCDTRDDVLARDLVEVTYRPGGCKVATGVLHDPYTGETIRFRRGVTTSVLVQIDHVVALADAWEKGAQSWSPERRTSFANDRLELLAVGAAVNDAKGAGDAATWLPPRRAYRCAYVARQVAVKLKYGLWVTAAEKDAMARVLATCPSQPLPR